MAKHMHTANAKQYHIMKFRPFHFSFGYKMGTNGKPMI